jgi:MoaA/NifB/PqqE/SkfB family radical SAM enzyme
MVTNFCPSKCSFCNACSSPKREERLSLSDMLKVVYIGHKLGYRGIYFSGGEATTMLYDLVKVVKYAKKLGYPNIHLSTNSFFGVTDEHAEKVIKLLEKSGLTHIYISFDYDHLKFIPYKNIINGIKAAIKAKFRSFKIVVIDREKTKKKNTEYLKKMGKDLNGKYYESFLSKFSFLVEQFFPAKKYNFIIIPGGKKVEVERYTPKYEGRGRRFKNEINFKNIKHYLFRSCYLIPTITIGWNGKLLGCSYMPALYNNTLTIGNVKNKDLKIKMAKPRELLFGGGFHPLLTLIRVYLSASSVKNKKINKILGSKYQNKCEFCTNLIKVVDIKKLKMPSNFRVFLFFIKNWHLLLESFLLDFFRNLTCLDLKYAFFKAKVFDLLSGKFF